MNYALSIWDYHNNKLIDLRSPNISIKGQAHTTNLKKNINGLKELDFILPLYILDDEGQQKENFRWDYIKNELLVKLEYQDEYDWFVIKTFDEVRNTNGTLLSNIQCKHISNLLAQSGLDLYIDEVGNINYLLNLVLENTGWIAGEVDIFREENGEEKLRNFKVERSNTYNAIQNLAELFNGYPIFNPDKTIDFKKEVGQNNGVVFRYGKNLQHIKRTIGNSDVITKLWVEGGSDNVGLVTIADANPTGENYILNFDYFIDGGFLTQEQIDAIEAFETGVTPINSDINTGLTNLNTAYNTKLEKESLLEGKTITKAAKSQMKEEIDLAIQTETDSAAKTALQQESNLLAGEISTLYSEIATLNSEITNLENDITNYQNDLDGYMNNKQSLSNNLYLLLSDFIREGLWQDTNYIDSQALFNDALEQSKVYAYPQVSYEMSILDLSNLTGYEIEKFNLGDIIRIIDDKLKIDTLGRITEEIIPLDNPHKVTVQIGNYYSNFEDLFKKISQSAEVIKQRKDVYERVSAINPDGTINYEALQQTFNNNKFRVMSGTNNKVSTDEKGITVKDLIDPNKIIRINAGGIFITVDGGETWKVGMSPEGLSALNITSGVIDTKLLQIWNSEQPRFKWSSNGLYAYGDDGTGGIDTNKWIRFNQDGIFFTLDNGNTYEIEFSWDGLKMDGKAIKARSLSFNSLSGGSAILGGSGNGNGVLSIRDASNVEKILLNNQGVELSNGAKLIGDSGVLSVLLFQSSGSAVEFNSNNFEKLGYHSMWDYYESTQIMLNGYVPSNFTVVEARVTLKVASIEYINSEDGNGVNRNGLRSAKNIRIQKAGNTHAFNVEYWGSEIYWNDDFSPTDRTSMIWGSQWTPSPSKNVQIKVGTVTDNDALTLFPAGQHFTFLVDSASADHTWNNSAYGKLEVILVGYKS